MKLPLNWLKEYVPELEVSPEAYMERMALSGTEVEGYERLGEEIDKVVVGKILKIEKHPDADRLVVCQVDAGTDIQIVTGAPNVFEGAMVPVALDGSRLPGGVKIKKGKLRGVVSEGMMCSGRELGVTDDDYPGADVDGILILKEEDELTPGTDMKEVLGLTDTVFEAEILANRPDCLSVMGMARETAAVFDLDFEIPAIEYEESRNPMQWAVSVEVEDKDLCPRYMARVVKNVRIGPSPAWMRRYLQAAGVRSINNAVDITNFVMLETGQPLHAFDMRNIRENRIVVRRAKAGENLVTLDGKDRELDESMLVIADGVGPVGLAGIMGGENSEIKEDTVDILIESAKFDGTNIRLTSRKLGLATEASARYEKGVDILTTQMALERAAQLMQQLCGAEVLKGRVDILSAPMGERTIRVPVKRINDLGGVKIDGREMADILDRLFMLANLEGDELTVMVPSFRGDIKGPADIAEEVLRLYGYDKIPYTLPKGGGHAGGLTPFQRDVERVRDTLVGLGFYETYHYSFMSESDLAALRLPENDELRKAVTILNPLSADMGMMRTTMVPAMLDALIGNVNKKREKAALFELGRVYLPGDGELPEEPATLCLGAYGRDMDFYGFKGRIEALFAAFGVPAVFEKTTRTYLHPGRAAEIRVNGETVGVMGEVHPLTLAAYGAEGRVHVAELDLTRILSRRVPAHYTAVSRHPAVKRDLALVVKEEVTVGAMTAVIEKAGGRLLSDVQLFDIYRSPELGEGMKSVAFALTFQSLTRTLQDEEVDEAVRKILDRLEKDAGAVLRS
ncbi:phenylalanine--tRNA ligase subunit beta [Gehongia tenuis]|uniref:Phenylalanine--tRNA ligase beta subunit n=1 Tax=Gehongia tenuis TaxID=2763655 RepID=A0A926HK65_9FIRM|nr:phenylalanine--tRNA ligase subunit beta [Gehongia tenuis]MBC8530642.1 phenylalanine--tRNA ligase subunit beta [Gehongia tenuis]